MLFSSISFLYYFLPCVLLVYFIVPKRVINVALLSASLIFYAWGEPRYIVLMIISIIVGYIAGLLIDICKNQRQKQLVLVASVSVCLGFLGFFKYADFFIDNFNKVTGSGVSLLKLALPIGISFYTFQIISYIVDVYRGEADKQKNIINLATYIVMFPQLIAGPILRYTDIAKQLKDRKYDIDGISWGIRRFILGLGKKVLIANLLGEFCEIFKASDDKSVLFFWGYAIASGLHVYFDFSGYSDMAIGLGRIMGFKFMENFNYPFISKSITEFWRRWHISLGTWFRDYVYIPLGGNRVGQLKWFRNIFIVWMLTGFWHGAAWNFVVWGLFFGILLIVEKKWLLGFLEKHNAVARIYLLVLVNISFVIFNAVDMTEAFSYIRAMFGGLDIPVISDEGIYYLRSYGVVFLVACIGATPIVKNVATKLWNGVKTKRFMEIGEVICLFAILILATAYLVDGSFNPFLYFRF